MENSDTIYQTSSLGETAYLLAKKNPLLDAQESTGNVIFLFEKTPQLINNLDAFYSGEDESFTLLGILKKLTFIVHNKNLLPGFVQRYKIQRGNP